MKVYDEKIDAIEKKFQKLRDEVEKEVKPIVEKMAIALNRNCINTQWAFNLSRNEKRDETKAFEELQKFLNTLEDKYGICLYFQVVDQEFIWL